MGDFLAAEIAEPLGLSLWIDLPESEEYRVAPQFTRKPLSTVDVVQARPAGLAIDIGSRLIRAILAGLAIAEIIHPATLFDSGALG
ncbi:hypothetical protein [Nocardia arthritidis]|uniref:hypothetical protein n=1 Tax=Nocardia arthritidis TaxID=228602 RepID=UPI001EECE118